MMKKTETNWNKNLPGKILQNVPFSPPGGGNGDEDPPPPPPPGQGGD